MKVKKFLSSVFSIGLVLVLVGSEGPGLAQGPGPQGPLNPQDAVGTAFTYQGRLTDGGSPANGEYDFLFKLYDAATGGGGFLVIKDNTTVTDGLFTVELDFGSGHFTGEARYLEIAVRPGASSGLYTTLSPRQALTPAPYALSLRPGAGVIGAIPGDDVVYAENTAMSDYSGGVEGYASATNGSTFGVYGLNASPDGAGVLGYAKSTTSGTYGRPYGVEGYSISGQGVHGDSDTTHGVYGETYGDWGWASGVYGKSFKDHAIGVTGWNTGAGTGVFALSVTGIGIVAKSGSNNIIEAWDTDPTDDRRWFVRNDGQVYADGSFHNTGADFAEMLPAVEGLEPGDVLVIGLDGQLLRSSSPYATGVMGVYSTEPGFVGGSDEEMENHGKVPLAIVGIVPVKASAENGPIAPGDLLTTSSTPGHAMRAGHFVGGAIIGKALEPLEEGTGIIQMLVMLQ